LELFCSDHHGYQRACDLINGQASTGHPGHQCSHALGRPSLHLVSSSRRPRLETVDRVTSSPAPHIAQFLCSSQGPFLRPGPQNVDRVARRGRSRPAVAPGLQLAPALPGHTLTASSTTASLGATGMTIRGEPAFGRADQSRHNLVSGGSKDPNHDAVIRIGSKCHSGTLPLLTVPPSSQARS
jgi:hypothetical protein